MGDSFYADNGTGAILPGRIKELDIMIMFSTLRNLLNQVKGL